MLTVKNSHDYQKEIYLKVSFKNSNSIKKEKLTWGKISSNTIQKLRFDFLVTSFDLIKKLAANDFDGRPRKRKLNIISCTTDQANKY